jgi:hypothetical protein
MHPPDFLDPHSPDFQDARFGGRDTLAVWRPARAPEVEAEDRCAQNMRIGRTLNIWVEGLLVVAASETYPGANVHMFPVDASDEVT